MESGRTQYFTYLDKNFNVHHSVSENYEDPFTKLHMHSVYELYYLIDGEGIFNISGNSYKLEPGMILFLRPGEAHSLNLTPNKRYERISLHFDGTYFENIPSVCNILKALSNSESGTENCFIPSGESNFCKKLLSDMTNPETKDKGEKLLALSTNLPALLYNLYTRHSHHVSAASSYGDRLVRQIIKYIDENLYKSWTLDDLAGNLYRDKAYLNRRFKKIIGTGIWDYTIRKRIIGIKQQMHSFTGVDEAFKASGFGDYSTFFRNYVKICGCTPSEDINKQITR